MIAYGYIFDENDYTIEGYNILVFEEYELREHLKMSDNGKYCFFKGDAICFWRDIEKPELNAT